MKIMYELALQKNVHPSFLEFIGIQDESEMIGLKLYWFNIMDSTHPNYKSSVAFKVEAQP